MATMKRIAEKAGVSLASVSHVVNGTKKLSPATTERVNAAIRELDYHPRRPTHARVAAHVKTIGVLVEDIQSFPIPDMLCGIAEAIEPFKYQMLMYDLHLLDKLYNQYDLIGAYRDRINQGISLLMDSGADGVIYAAMHDRHLDGLIDAASRPLVYAYSLGTSQDSYVTYANKESASDVVRHLISKGHRRIAVIAGHPHSFPAMKRLSGFQIAMQEAGLTIPEGYLVYGDWAYDSGYAKMKELLRLPERPTAVFAMNDFMAAGCIHAILDSGLKVPEDISVAGFDNREACHYLLPPLTTVELPVKDIGRSAARMLIDLIRNPAAVPRQEILPCRLIERGSVGEWRQK